MCLEIYMNKKDLALNKPLRIICLKSERTKSYIFTIYV